MSVTRTSPVVPRPAATVVLLRDHPEGGVELYLLRRPGRSSFAPHAFVFPGGAVDAADGDEEILGLAPGFDPETARARMQLDSGEAGRRACAAHHVAAVREVFEEAGVLLGRRGDGAELGPADVERLSRARRDLLAGTAFAAVLLRHGLQLAPEVLVYAAHFITPEMAPKRFDTRFFLARTPMVQTAAVHPGEATEGGWYAPGELSERLRGNLTALMPPTRIICNELAAHASVDAALRDLGTRPVTAVLFAPADVSAGRLPERLPGPAPG
jgi:8-oxo-dGTP pyrophosphatase MutT (NUDIX family)